MSRVWNILLVGVGGQGIVLTSDILSAAALAAGFDVKKSEIHGMSQRGGSVFSHVQDKDQALQDLHRLTKDNNSSVRWGAANALGSVFSHVPDKDQAWQDLHRLTKDKDSSVRMWTAFSLGSAFSHVP